MANNFNETLSTNLDWDSQIENVAKQIMLEDGTYQFEVTELERSRYEGSERIPSCNMAVITLKITTSEGEAFLKDRLLLTSALKWKLASFFRSISPEPLGETFIMHWDKVVGSKGKLDLKSEEYTGKDGNKHTAKRISYCDPEVIKEDDPNWLPFK